MKNAESDSMPNPFVKSHGITLFNYNIVEKEREEIDSKKHKYYEFNYVEIEGVITRKKLIDALIRAKIDVNKEFKKMALSKISTEYKEYRQFIESCKTIADEALKNV